MSVLTEFSTYGNLNSELTDCPRTAAVLGELAAQWQHMMRSLQGVEQETVSTQNLANAIENMNRTRIDRCSGKSTALRLKDGERLYPKSCPGCTSLAGFAREIAAWLGCVDPKHQAGKLTQQIGRDGRHAADDKYVDLVYELAVTVAHVTEGAARSTVLKATHAQRSHGFVAWQALVDGYAPLSSNDPATAPQPILATPKKVQGRKGIEREAHGVVIESG